MHKGYLQLNNEIEAAKAKVLIGRVYRHYKHHDKYVVKGFTVLESTDEICVRYSSVNETNVEFSRTISSWLQSVDGVARFQLLEE